MKKISFGLCLSAGGANGFCHIGILDRLFLENISFSEVSGCSIGSIVGAFLCSGKYEILREIAYSFNFYKYLKLQDPSPSLTGLIKGNKIEKFLLKYLGDISFSDLKIPFSIISTDLKTGKEIVFSEGKLIPAIRASISIPGVFEPYNYNGFLFVDGGLCNPLPINVLKSNKIIAVDLFSNANDFDMNKLNIYRVFLQSLSIFEKSAVNETKKSNDTKRCIYLTPKTDVDFLDFSNPIKLIRSGYMCCDKKIDKILKNRF